MSWEVWGEEAKMETILLECWSLSVARLDCHLAAPSVTHLSSHTFMGLPGITIYPLMSLQLTFRAGSGSSRSSHSRSCRQWGAWALQGRRIPEIRWLLSCSLAFSWPSLSVNWLCLENAQGERPSPCPHLAVAVTDSLALSVLT